MGIRTKSMTPLVSVLIVTRNRPAELHKTLMDLRLQAYSPLELIVVDDASDEPIAPRRLPRSRSGTHITLESCRLMTLIAF